MIQADPSGRFVLHVDLGLDQIFVWKFDEQKGVLTPNEPPAVSLPPGDGPRHFHFHPNGRWFYSIQEEGSTIVLFDYDAATGRLASRQTISTLPPGFAGSNFCSEILVSADGRFVYAGNRLHDSIGIFSIGPNGDLTLCRGRMDARELSAQLQLRPHRPVPLLLQSARRQHRRLPGGSQNRRPQTSPAITPPSAILRSSSSSIWRRPADPCFRDHGAPETALKIGRVPEWDGATMSSSNSIDRRHFLHATSAAALIAPWRP